MQEMIKITYRITCPIGGDIEKLSREVALEQTVEVPEEILRDSELKEKIVGKVLDIKESSTPNQYQVCIAFDPDITGYEIPQFLNVLYGNSSIKNNIRIVGLHLPELFLKQFQGPRYGIEGLRRIVGVYDRPLAATALKPMGTSADELALMAEAFALGGGDIIKDDHGLANQAFCLFEERVRKVQHAVEQANIKTGRQTLYFPNLIGTRETIEEQIKYVVNQGVRGVLMSPFIIGPDTVRYFSEKYPVAIMAHPAFSGTHFHDPAHGITPAVLLGEIFRLLGADISVFPNSGGRFGFSDDECKSICDGLRNPIGHLAPAFPAPAGGMCFDNISSMAKRYGPDAVYLIGGALFKDSDDLQASTKKMMAVIGEQFSEKQLEPEKFASACELPGLSNKDSILEHLIMEDDFQWKGRTIEAYKTSKEMEFKNISRQELIGKYGETTSFDLRFFQIEPGGYSSLEKHNHEHVIIGARGKGELKIGHQIVEIRPHDVAYVSPMNVHQLKNNSTEPFGFFCIVDRDRDKPQEA